MSVEPSTIWTAAAEAARLVEPGMVVGLGTGRAAAMFVRALAARGREGLSFRGIPTSNETRRLAEELGVSLADLDACESLDLDVDGADEVDPNLDLIKGHGGALLRERVVASVSKRVVILVGDEKLVPRLGSLRSVPVEVVPFAAPVVRRRLSELGCEVQLRTSDGEPFVSDNGNHILEARFEEIPDPRALERRIDEIPGVVDCGLFIGLAHLVLVQSNEGVRRLERT